MKPYWIGVKFVNELPQWRDGTPFDFVYWHTSRIPTRKCVYTPTDMRWTSKGCNYKYLFSCKYLAPGQG